MKIRLPPILQRRLKGELALAKHREVGGLLMAEHLSDDDYRIVDLSVQRTGGSAVCFIRDPKKHRAQLDRFFARTGRNYTRFNYLGEWHSHPWAPVSPSSRDSRTMQALVRDPEVGANVLVLVIVRLAAGGTLESSATVFRAGDMARRADLTLESTDNTDLSVDMKNALRLATQPEQDDPLDSKARYAAGDEKRRIEVLNRFQGEAGRRLRLEAYAAQKLVAGNCQLVDELDSKAQLTLIPKGQILIEQGATDNDVYLILAGAFDISVNGRVIRRRVPNDHVGEMAAIELTQRRSATVIAAEDSVVAKLTEADFAKLGKKYPEIYLYIARELARRLLQRNALISQAREKIRVFIISSVESLGVARALQNAFAHDPFLTVIWTDGVFRASNYTLQSPEDAVDDADFAIAVAHADDITESKGKAWPAPRDNVIFELGLFMGRLGKARAILMEPRDEGVKLPSDMAGLTTIPYRYAPGPDAAALMGSACNNLRDYILRLGPNN